MGFLKTLKEIFVLGSVFAEISEENLRSQKMKLGMTKYKKWFRKTRMHLEAIRIMQQEKGLSTPDSWTEKISLLEKEMKETERF